MTVVINPYAVRRSSDSMKEELKPSRANSRECDQVPTATTAAKVVVTTPKPPPQQQHLTAATTALNGDNKPALVTHVKAPAAATTVARGEVVSKPPVAATVRKKGGSFRQQLQQEVAQLKRQQKLQKERLQWQKEQRKSLKKQQKQQQAQQTQVLCSVTPSFLSASGTELNTEQLLSSTQQSLERSISPQAPTIATATTSTMLTGAVVAAAAADSVTEIVETTSTVSPPPLPSPSLPNTAPTPRVIKTTHPQSSTEIRYAGEEVGDDSTVMITTTSAKTTTTTSPHPRTPEAATAAELLPPHQLQQQQQQLLQQKSHPPDYYPPSALYPFGYTPHPQPWSASYHYYNNHYATLLTNGGGIGNTSLPYPPPHMNHLNGYPQHPKWMPEQLPHLHPTMPPHYFMCAADALQWQPPPNKSFAFQPQQQQPRLLSLPSHSRHPQPLWKDPVSSTAFTQTPLCRDDTSNHARTTKLKRPITNYLLAAHPCQAPSPFARTHEILPEKTVVRLIRHHATQTTFGMTLQLDMQSALVDPDTTATILLETGVTGTVPTATATTTSSTMPETNLLLGGKNGDPKNAAADIATTAGGGVTTFHSAAAESFPNLTAEATVATSTALLVPPSLHQRRRRRRVYFSVVKVLDPSPQNERQPRLQQQQHQSDDEKQVVRLQKDDILLTIAGTPIAGLSFAQACALFQKCSTEPDQDGMIYCELTVARRKAEPPAAVVTATPKPALPSLGKGKVPMGSVNDSQLASTSSVEQFRWVAGILQAITDPRRLLGGPMVLPWNPSAAATAAVEPVRHGSGGDDDDYQWYQLHSNTAWNNIRNQVESAAQQKALQYWKAQWKREPANIARGSREYMTDAQRSILRAAPRRPDNCCKCSSQEHQYVNDVQCPLYSNLRFLVDKNDDALTALDDATEVAKRNKALAKSLPRDLNVVEKAFKDRFVRTKVEQQADEAEARFVAKMREIQVAQCHQAIFAPSLSVMVLSAVVEVQAEFEGKDLPPLLNHYSSTFACHAVAAADMANSRNAEEEDCDDVDNVPLAALSKRPSSCKDGDDVAAMPNPANKRQRGNTPVRQQFLAKLVQRISQKWGHVFQEASNEEYAW